MSVAFDHQTLLDWQFPEVVHSWTRRDVMLYALGLGIGSDPLDPAQLRYVYEKDLEVFPTMPVVLGHPGPWMSDPRSGIDMVKVLHAEQQLEIHRPLPVEGSSVAQTRVIDVIDKGAGKGALILMQRTLRDQASGELLCTQLSTAMARGNGGAGGSGNPGPAPAALPERAPDAVIDIETSPRSALLYRLSGDYNPVHADPAVAARAGFSAPILHGLASYGIAARALLQACGEGASLRSIGVRFSAPVYPGETLRSEIWRDGNLLSFRARVLQRDVLALNNGHAVVA
jgi:acyl dehydratase